MKQNLFVYNTLTRKKEEFKPLDPASCGHVCLRTYCLQRCAFGQLPYLCILRSYFSVTLQHLGYKVRYVRNITDAGHLEGDAGDEGEDKISKKAKIAQLEPMEIATESIP